jgi:hypothetical protein
MSSPPVMVGENLSTAAGPGSAIMRTSEVRRVSPARCDGDPLSLSGLSAVFSAGSHAPIDRRVSRSTSTESLSQALAVRRRYVSRR